MDSAGEPSEAVRHQAVTREHWAQFVAGLGAVSAVPYPDVAGIEPGEVAAIYGPLVDLIDLGRQQRPPAPGPFVVGVTGSVVAGKTTLSEVLVELLAARGLKVAVVATDGFLLPNAQLQDLGLMGRKGFPETYDNGGLKAFVEAVVAGEPVDVPTYSHETYDVNPQTERIESAEVLILEGLIVLQELDDVGPISAVLDFSIYIDADEDDLLCWFISRVDSLRQEMGGDPDSYFHLMANMSDEEFRAVATAVWSSVNLPNLHQHVLPSRERADLIVTKDLDHRIVALALRH